MKRIMVAAALLVAGSFLAASAQASKEICQRQMEATANIVMARDGGWARDSIISQIRESASSKASADVMAESVTEIFADDSLDSEAASKLVYERCIAALGE